MASQKLQHRTYTNATADLSDKKDEESALLKSPVAMSSGISASRVLGALAFSAIVILLWENFEAALIKRPYHCEGDVISTFSDTPLHLQQQPTPAIDIEVVTQDEPEMQVEPACDCPAVADDLTESPVDAAASRQCIMAAFEFGTKSREANVYSQFGEDGIIAEILGCVPPQTRTYIEIGVPNGEQCTTRQLREAGWTGVLLGSGEADSSINLISASPTGDDVIPLLEEASASATPDLLAVHANLHTFWVLQAALQHGYRPRMLIAQINRNFHPADTFVAPHSPGGQWDDSTVFSAAAGAFDALFEQFGYSTVAINQEQDSIFAVVKEAVGDERLLTMEHLADGITGTQLCQPAHACTGDSEWLQVTAETAPSLKEPRDSWYNNLPSWTVRCVSGGHQVQWGVQGSADALPHYAPGVVALLPCMEVAKVTELAAKMVEAQTGPPRTSAADVAAEDTTDCSRRPETKKSMDRKRACLKAAFAEGSTAHETKRYSQCNEDGIISAIFSCIYPQDKFYVEFGVEAGTECTTRALHEDGWTGLLMDGSNSRPELNLQQEFFNAEGIAYQFQKHFVPQRFDHLTVDIDQNTFWVLHAVLLAGYRPRVIVAEINRNFHPVDTFVVPYAHDVMWNGGGDFGASPGAMNALFAAFGYHTIALDQDQINMYAVQSCEVGPQPLFSMDEVTAGLTKLGICLGLHGCNNGENLEVTDEVAQMLAQPRAEWYDKMPRWHIVCSEDKPVPPAACAFEWPRGDETQVVRVLTGVRLDGDEESLPEIPRFDPETLTRDACAPVAEATAAAAKAAAAKEAAAA